MKSQIIIHGSRVHDEGFRLALLQFARKSRYINFEAFNDTHEGEELVVVLVEGEESKINDLIDKIQIIKPGSAVVRTATIEPYTGHIQSLSSFSQDLHMEQMAKAVPILVEMKDLHDQTLTEIRDLRNDFRSSFDNRLTKAE